MRAGEIPDLPTASTENLRSAEWWESPDSSGDLRAEDPHWDSGKQQPQGTSDILLGQLQLSGTCVRPTRASWS